MKILTVLVGCEESQTVCKEFRKLGHEAYSCDLLPCSGGHPEWHFEQDIFDVLKLKTWDLVILHPPCTYLSVSGAAWMYHPEDKHLPYSQRRAHPKFPNRRQQQIDGLNFVRELMKLNMPYLIENPVSVISSNIRKPDQIIQPYMFGDEATKTTCLWLNKLPKLTPTNIVGKGERITFKSGKTMTAWYASLFGKPRAERAKERSKTFPGIAKAIAHQYSNYLINQIS